jgi:DNA-directed RNA polymerase II subunit RPB2
MMTNALQERLFEQSDPYIVHVCERCGLFAVANAKKNSYHCTGCQRSDICRVALPYAMKLLIQELLAMAITMRIRVDSE